MPVAGRRTGRPSSCPCCPALASLPTPRPLSFASSSMEPKKSQGAIALLRDPTCSRRGASADPPTSCVRGLSHSGPSSASCPVTSGEVCLGFLYCWWCENLAVNLWEAQLCHLLATWPRCTAGPSPGRRDSRGPSIPGAFAGFRDAAREKASGTWRNSISPCNWYSSWCRFAHAHSRRCSGQGSPRYSESSQVASGWGARSLTCVGVAGAMLITGAGDTVDIGAPQGCLPLVSRSTRFTELAHVSRGA